jgi:hypothetical protein
VRLGWNAVLGFKCATLYPLKVCIKGVKIIYAPGENSIIDISAGESPAIARLHPALGFYL